MEDAVKAFMEMVERSGLKAESVMVTDDAEVILGVGEKTFRFEFQDGGLVDVERI